MTPDPKQTTDHEFDPIEAEAEPPAEHLDIQDLAAVDLDITADLGHCHMLVREILKLNRGSVVTLNKQAGEMTDVYLNGRSLAKGEVVVIGDSLHVRIGEITGMSESEGDAEE